MKYRWFCECKSANCISKEKQHCIPIRKESEIIGDVADLPVEYIVRDGNTLILNTRTSQALTQAGIPRSQWNAIDRTGIDLYEEMLSGQLSRNKLTSEGISTVRPSGGK